MHHCPRFQVVLLSYNKMSSMILKQKLTHWSTELNWNPRHKSTPRQTWYFENKPEIHRKKESIFINLCWSNWMATCRRIQICRGILIQEHASLSRIQRSSRSILFSWNTDMVWVIVLSNGNTDTLLVHSFDS